MRPRCRRIWKQVQARSMCLRTAHATLKQPPSSHFCVRCRQCNELTVMIDFPVLSNLSNGPRISVSRKKYLPFTSSKLAILRSSCGGTNTLLNTEFTYLKTRYLECHQVHLPGEQLTKTLSNASSPNCSHKTQNILHHSTTVNQSQQRLLSQQIEITVTTH